jgi:hypothetical protein
MKRFLRWCRRPYLRIYFSEPPIQHITEDAMKALHAATANAQQAMALYEAASEQLEKLGANCGIRAEVATFFRSSPERRAYRRMIPGDTEAGERSSTLARRVPCPALCNGSFSFDDPSRGAIIDGLIKRRFPK